MHLNIEKLLARFHYALTMYKLRFFIFLQINFNAVLTAHINFDTYDKKLAIVFPSFILLN